MGVHGAERSAEVSRHFEVRESPSERSDRPDAAVVRRWDAAAGSSACSGASPSRSHRLQIAVLATLIGCMVVAGYPQQAASAPPALPGSGGFNAQLFEPLPAQGLNRLNMSTSDTLTQFSFSAGIFFHYADDPVTTIDVDTDEVFERIVDSQLIGELMLSFALFDWASVGVVMPAAAYQTGDPLERVGLAGDRLDGQSLGDLRVVTQLRLLDPASFGGFGLHLVVPLAIPTGDREAFLSDGELRVTPTLGMDWRSASGLWLGLNAGYEVRPARPSHTYISDDTIRWSVGVRIPLVRELALVATGFGSYQTGSSVDPQDPSQGLTREVGTPVEVLAGFEILAAEGFVASAGVGLPVVRGVGTPDLRAYVTLGWTPFEEADADGDGIADVVDDCPNTAEDLDGYLDEDGCPELDDDGDGIPDALDSCPQSAEDPDGFDDEDGCPDADNDRDGVPDVVDLCPTRPEDNDGDADGDGCPDVDGDQDGVTDSADRCPNEPEDVDGFNDADGCPDRDNDGDGVLDTEDSCPLKAETINGVDDEDGCPDVAVQGIDDQGDRLKLSKSLSFKGRTSQLNDDHRAVLSQVAAYLKGTPSIASLEVASHTDSEGTTAQNRGVTQRRADAIRAFLVAQGVDAGRVIAVGYGEERPIANNASPYERAKNNRVELIVKERSVTLPQ